MDFKEKKGFEMKIKILFKSTFFIAILSILFIYSNNIRVKGYDDEGDFVYSTNHFNGFEYSSTFIPSKIDTIYILSNSINAITSRSTNLYYWPITNEIKADWEKQNIIIEGNLEILKNNYIFENLSLTNYIIQFDNKDKINTTQLYYGLEAEKKHQEFLIIRRKYRDDLYEYNQKMNLYRAEFTNALEKLREGKIEEDQLPIPPEPLEDMSIFSTDLLKGFIISLPKGEYNIRLRLPNGDIQIGSEKKLIIFEEQSEGIGFEIISSERWTDPSYSNSSKDVIMTVPDTELYLKPYWQKKYNEKYYQKMNNPQETKSRADRFIWIPTNNSINGVLISDQNESIEMRSYLVRQILGSALGYEIVELDDPVVENPSFSGYKIKATHNNENFSIKLMNKDGNYLNESIRNVRVVLTNKKSVILLAGFIPLLIGSLAIFFRKRFTKEKAP